MVSQTLNHYKILSKLGQGGMGDVYLAEDTKLSREVALKVLPRALASDPLFLQRFHREAKAVASLNHPNIVTIYSIEDAPGEVNGESIHFFTMERLEGESLGSVIPTAGFPTREFLDLAIQIADALNAAHARGIMHRDLKPQNIMVAASGQVTVLDFGLAKETPADPLPPTDETRPMLAGDGVPAKGSHLTREGAVLGTVAYMSPEQAMGKRIDHRSDLFSLGIIFYEMATGQRPFAGDSSAEHLSALLRDAPLPASQLRASIPPPLGDLIHRCLEKEPDARIQSAEELKSIFEQIRSDETNPPEASQNNSSEVRTPSLESDSVSDSTPPHSKPRRSRLMALGIGAALLLAFFGPRLFSTKPSPLQTDTSSGEATRTEDSGSLVRSENSTPLNITETRKHSIAIARFESRGNPDNAWLSDGIPEMLLTGLAQTEGIEVIGSDRLFRAAAQVEGTSGGDSDHQAWGEIARGAGADAMVLGSVISIGKELRIDVRVEDLTTGQILAAESVSGDDLFVLLDDLTRRVRSDLQVIDDAPSGIAALTTNSVAAYKSYTEGLEYHRFFRWSDARNAFREAVRLDPDFVLADFYLAQLEEDQAVVRIHLKKAFANLDRLPERQRLLVQLQQAQSEGATQNVEATANQLIARYPDMEDTYSALGEVYWRRNQLDEVVATYERGLIGLPDSGPLYNFLAWSLQEVGRYDEAYDAMESYRRLSPDEPDPHDALGTALLLAERPAESIPHYDRATSMGFAWSHLSKAFAEAALGEYDAALNDLERLRETSTGTKIEDAFYFTAKAWLLGRVGRYAEAEEVLQEQRLFYESLNRSDILILGEIVAAQLAMERQDNDGTLQAIAKVRKLTPTLSRVDRPSWIWTSIPFETVTMICESFEGIIEARQGNLVKAQRHLERAEQIPESRFGEGILRTLQAEIALANGDYSAAEHIFQLAEPRGRRNYFYDPTSIFADWRGRVRQAAGDLDGAVDAYENVLSPGDHRKWFLVVEPRHVLELARLLDASGDAVAAEKEWARFLTLWKDADSDLPELTEARSRLTP